MYKIKRVKKSLLIKGRYTSRKMVNGKWVYTYKKDTPHKTHTLPEKSVIEKVKNAIKNPGSKEYNNLYKEYVKLSTEYAIDDNRESLKQAEEIIDVFRVLGKYDIISRWNLTI